MNPNGGTLSQELHRTAEMLVDIAETRGVYFAIALLYDSSYDTARIKALLPILLHTKGALREGSFKRGLPEVWRQWRM